MSKKVFGLCLVLSTLITAPLFAQTFGEISGLVTDSTGSVVVGAAITVTNPETNFNRKTLTNGSGNYSFPSLPPGLYDVKVEKQGFQAEVRSSVQLQVQQAARLDFHLSVGAVTETVQVTGGAPLLNTENAAVGTVIEQKRIEDLPLNGRSFVSLIALSPNVTTGQTSYQGFADQRGGGGDRGTVSIAIAGQRREYLYFTLDGVSNSDVDFNTYAFLPSVDALQEFKVQTGTYSAEFGYEAGQVNISTRSGTNGYHGALFEFLRNNKVDARPYAFTSNVPPVAPFKWNQFGFTLGGPVQIPKVFNGKNRLFFMSNYEGFRLRTQNQVLASVASPAMRGGNFSQLLPNTVIKDPLNNNQPFPGNIVPIGRANPSALKLLEFLPLPNVPGGGLANNYLEVNGDSIDKDQFTQRIDFVESAKSTWFGRYSFQNEQAVNPTAFAAATAVNTAPRSAMLANTRILTPTFVNEFRTGWLQYAGALVTPLAFKRDVTDEVGIKLLQPVPPASWGIPQLQISGFTTYGDSLQGPWITRDQTFQWIDNVSWTRGGHSIRFGVEIRRDRYNESGNQQLRGGFVFNGGVSNYAFTDYMLGYASLTTMAAGGVAVGQFRRTNQYYYINDTWKVRPSITIEAGIRYEFTPQWTSRANDFVNTVEPQFTLQPQVADLSLHPYLARNCAAYGETNFYPAGTIIRFNPAIQTKCVTGPGTQLVFNDYKNWAPRLGIAWSPNPNWTVRVGAGMFYSQDEGNAQFDTVKNMFTQLTPAVEAGSTNFTFQNPLGAAPGPNPCGVSLPLVCISTPVVFLNEPHRRTPYLEQVTLNVQHQFASNTVLEAGYLGSAGHRIEFHISHNNVLPSSTGSIASRSPWPELSNVLPTLGNGTSAYHAGSLKLTRRLSNGLSALVSYTFSKSIDSSSGINPDASYFFQSRVPQQGWCIKCEYGLSDFDTRHRFVASVLYELPFGKGKQFLNHGIASVVLGGWQLNSILSWSTGFPETIMTGILQSHSNSYADRPNSVPGVNYQLANPTTNLWFNTQAFKLNDVNTFGNVGRNTVIGPGVFGWDFSTLKDFNFTERTYLQFRFECFNCSNHPRWGDPGNLMSLNQFSSAGFVIPNTGNFGQITNTRGGLDMRQLQFGLKLVF